jgi:hypothetical protein
LPNTRSLFLVHHQHLGNFILSSSLSDLIETHQCWLYFDASCRYYVNPLNLYKLVKLCMRKRDGNTEPQKHMHRVSFQLKLCLCSLMFGLAQPRLDGLYGEREVRCRIRANQGTRKARSFADRRKRLAGAWRARATEHRFAERHARLGRPIR